MVEHFIGIEEVIGFESHLQLNLIRIYMGIIIKIFIIIAGITFVLGIYNKVRESKENKKIMDDVKRQVEKNRRPSSDYTFPDEKRFDL